MPIPLSASTENLDPKIVTPGWYKIKLDGFRPQRNKNQDSFNLNPVLRITEDANFEGAFVNTSLSLKMATEIYDFTHAFGLQVEKTPDGGIMIPGDFEGDPNKPESWRYIGPLVGRTFEAEVHPDSWGEGKTSNKIKQYRCAYADCKKDYPDRKHKVDYLARKP